MRKMKWIMILALVIMAGLVAGVPAARADANLMENGSVQYVVISNEEDLRQYIDADGLYASQENLGFQKSGNTYRVIVDEAGDLAICPLTDHASDGQIKPEFALYSDFKLTSQLVSGKYTTSDRSDYLRVHVEPGTYYYRSIGGASSSRRNDRKNTLTVFIGFIPDDSGSDRSGADQSSNTQSPEAAVIDYTYINDKPDLYDYINHNGKYSVQVNLDIHQVSESYAVVIDEPGELVVCPMVKLAPSTGRYSAIVSVYSNRDLSSKILDSAEAQSGNLFDYYSVTVDPGVYYIQGVGGAAPSQGDNPLTIYLGFIPADHRYIEQSFPEENNTAASLVTVNPLTSENELVNIAESRQNSASSHELVIHETSEAYAFCVDEPGKLVFTAITSGYADTGHYCTEIRVYSDSNLTSQIMSFPACNDTDVKCSSILVDAGIYYYQLIGGANKNREAANTDVYIGFLPSSGILSIDHTEVTATEARITFSIAETYDPDKYLAIVRVVPGRILPYAANNKDIWQDQSMDNAIESHEFIATENGVYTARIAGTELQTYLLTFEVTGITEDAPEQEQPMESESTPEPEITDAPAETKTPAAMNPDEMRKYIRMLEDQIDDLGLELPEFSPSLTQEEYMKQLEQVLHENGYEL